VPRKSILTVMLMAAIAVGAGILTEDLCACGGSFADDPSTPVRMTELALPSHTQAAQKAVAPSVSIWLLPQPATRRLLVREVPETGSPAIAARPVPIRC
jgi:hypothetical protein